MLRKTKTVALFSLLAVSSASSLAESHLADGEVRLRDPASVVLIKSSVNAQETLAKVMREALQTYPSLKVKEGELESARFDVSSAQWGRYPSLVVSAEAPDKGSTQGQLQLRQPLWTGGRITGQIELSKAALAVSEAALSVEQLEVLKQTAAMYVELMRLEARIEASRSNEAEHRRLLETIQRRVVFKVSPFTDETQAASRLHQATTERVQIERQLADTRSKLEQLVGRPVGTLARPKDLTLAQRPLATWQQDALQFSPERKRRQAELDRSRAQVDLIQAQVMPTLFVAQQAQLGRLSSNTDRYRTFIGLEAATGAGLSSFSAVKASEAKRQAAADYLLSHERELAQQVEATFIEAEAMQAQIVPVRRMLVGADAIVDSYLRQFQVGRKNWLDVLNAQREKAQTYAVLADTEATLLMSRIRLYLLAGELQPDNLESLNAL